MSEPLQLSQDGFPIVQGITLVGIEQLPDRFRPLFPHKVFNAVQSKCFTTVYTTDHNLVVAAPTGCGKTCLLELAICRLVSRSRGSDFKVVYQAPTKSLCSERMKDWQTKFNHLGLQCLEVTGDTEQISLRQVQNADILIATPEKWDSMTRRWTDHVKLVRMIKLFLIDEVHILKEDRGACLEAVVSRMKSIGSDVRFITLSATVPNYADVATWLGRDNKQQSLPAVTYTFGEEFRPVLLQKHVYGLSSGGQNDFAFDKICNERLPEIIANHSTMKKPIMVFCFTRKSTEETAQHLAKFWLQSAPSNRLWEGPTQIPDVADMELHDCLKAAVAFHHGGLLQNDRSTIEKAYLNGDVSVICCTSTLATGVNLPCHLVIVKNTVVFTDRGCKEYSDLEVIQMLGRAGRPQFERTGIAVVITRAEKAQRYERMTSGQEVLESRLHQNLIEHLNAEIGLGTIHDLPSALKWLKGTFLFVRFCQNPDLYKLHNLTAGVDEAAEQICTRNIQELRQYGIITDEARFQCTELGNAMARYYMMFGTMKLFLGLPPKSTMSEILSAVAQAHEFKTIRFRTGEKQIFKNINSSVCIKFPVKVNLDLVPHKITLIIQAILGGVDIKSDQRFDSIRTQLQSEVTLIFQHISRLIRCIVDCKLHFEDSIGARNALELSRSFGARAWEDTALQMLQIKNIGPVAVRKLIGANIKSIEELEATEAQKIDMVLSKNPPFGALLLKELTSFPKLRVSLKMVTYQSAQAPESTECVRAKIRAQVGFMNDTIPTHFRSKKLNIIVLAETSDGHLLHFANISGKNFGKQREFVFDSNLIDPQQLIHCYVSCDEIAGTVRGASLHPNIPAAAFSRATKGDTLSRSSVKQEERPRKEQSVETWSGSQEYSDEELGDSDLAAVADAGFTHIDQVTSASEYQSKTLTSKCNEKKSSNKDQPPRRMRNGKWECRHRCQDKNTCKHRCCQEGLDKPPKPAKLTKTSAAEKNNFEEHHGREESRIRHSGQDRQTMLDKLYSSKKLNQIASNTDQAPATNSLASSSRASRDEIGLDETLLTELEDELELDDYSQISLQSAAPHPDTGDLFLHSTSSPEKSRNTGGPSKRPSTDVSASTENEFGSGIGLNEEMSNQPPAKKQKGVTWTTERAPSEKLRSYVCPADLDYTIPATSKDPEEKFHEHDIEYGDTFVDCSGHGNVLDVDSRRQYGKEACETGESRRVQQNLGNYKYSCNTDAAACSTEAFYGEDQFGNELANNEFTSKNGLQLTLSKSPTIESKEIAHELPYELQMVAETHPKDLCSIHLPETSVTPTIESRAEKSVAERTTVLDQRSTNQDDIDAWFQANYGDIAEMV